MSAELPLAGIRVVDLTSVVMGPLATQILGDLGADVITIEPRDGDTCRVMGSGPHPELSGTALNLLRNKRNVALDLKNPEGHAALMKLVATCQVVVTNLRPGPLRRARLSYEDVRRVRPDVVYCQAQGYPSDGPLADEPAYDDIVQAASGLADAARLATGVPTLAPTILADKVSGLTIAYAVCAALVRQVRSGVGEHIEVPMADAAAAFVLVEHGGGAIPRPTTGTPGYGRILNEHRRPQRTADGWINVLPYSVEHYDDLFAAGGVTALLGDARYSTRAACIQNAKFLYQQIESLLLARTTEQWLTFCRERGIPASPIVTLAELVDGLPDEQHPVAGFYKHIAPVARFATTPLRLRRHAPLIGQHTDEVLTELGYGGAELDDLRATGAIPAVRSDRPPAGQIGAAPASGGSGLMSSPPTTSVVGEHQ